MFFTAPTIFEALLSKTGLKKSMNDKLIERLDYKIEKGKENFTGRRSLLLFLVYGLHA
jgi:hypothetical protein